MDSSWTSQTGGALPTAEGVCKPVLAVYKLQLYIAGGGSSGFGGTTAARHIMVHLGQIVSDLATTKRWWWIRKRCWYIQAVAFNGCGTNTWSEVQQ